MIERKLGKKTAVYDSNTMKLTPIVDKSITDIPTNINWINGVIWPMWNNDKIGCCTQVSVASAIRTWSYNTSTEILLTQDNVIKNYSDESGYNGTPSTDQGAIEVNVLQKWCKDGYQTPDGIDKLFTFGYLNPRDTASIKKSIVLFGGIYIGMSLPDYALKTPSPVWEVSNTDTQIAGGHAMYVHGYDQNYLYMNTWATEWKMSWDFFQKYCDESYGLISQRWLNGKNTSPFGENLETLVNELRNITQ